MQWLTLVAMLTFIALPANAQTTFPPPEWYTPAPGSFITMAESDLSVLMGTIPTAHQIQPVDTSGWASYDATTVGGTNPPGAANFSSCASMSPGASDNGPRLECLLDGLGDQALLRIPNGTYDILTDSRGENKLYRFGANNDRRGIECASRGAVLNFNVGMQPGTQQNALRFLNGEGLSLGGSTTWNGQAGSVRGTTVIPVGSTSGFSTTDYAPGSWVVLTARPLPIQDDATRRWASKVVAIGSNTITIRDPLPEDFTGGNAQATPWQPAEDVVLRNCTIQYQNGDHLTSGADSFINTRGHAHFEISGNAFVRGYRSPIEIEQSADILFTGNDVYDSGWDKATNGYGIVIAETSRAWLHDNHIQHATGIAFSNNSQEVLVTFNDIRAPEVNPLFDWACDTDLGLGFAGPNDCNIVDHSSIHGPTVGSGYLHCSGRESDTLGANGDPACRGTGAGAIYSCVEFHDRSASNTLFMRNHCDGPIWFDASFGPGRNNFLYGNFFDDSTTTPEYQSNPGNKGGFWFRDNGPPGTGGYRQNAIWANNVFTGDFGGRAGGPGYNIYGDGVQVFDNVMANGCFDQDSAGSDPDGGACTTRGSEFAAVNTTWAWNCVGDDVHGSGACNYGNQTGPYARTMPSLPGFTDWPAFSVPPSSSSYPFTGPEMGDPDSASICLPAAQRYYGSCR